jgi:hypothetical protein
MIETRAVIKDIFFKAFFEEKIKQMMNPIAGMIP